MKNVKGYSLVELMIAVTVGIVLLGGVTNLLITTNRTIALSDGTAQNQETGRFAMDYMSKFIRKAGYSSDFTSFTPPIMVTSGDIVCPAPPAAPSDECASNNSNNRGDRLSIPFTISEGESMRSCAGTNLVADAVTGSRRFATVFWVDDNANSVSDMNLLCGTYDIDAVNWVDSSVPILSNVEAFEFQVGLASNASSKNSASYVTVNQVDDVSLVRSIRIAVLTSSQNQNDVNAVQTDRKSRTYYLLDQEYELNNDGQIRNIFTNTIELPNAIETAVLN